MPVLITILLTLTISFSPLVARAKTVAAPQISTASELIDAVNTLRASYGLPSYTPNSILMSLAQEHAEYMAALGMSNVHTDSRGFLPFQRALAAGYPVAGDIYTDVGYFSENVTGGVGKTAQDAVTEWMGDALHRGTMLSSDLRDVGGGVALIENTYYYCLDAGQSTGGTPRPFTPPPSYSTPVPTLIPNTPNADGSIKYIVQRGDTLGTISMAYDVSVADLRLLNNLPNDIIYPEQVLIIRDANTPTPTQPTNTPTERPTITPWPTSTPTSTETSFPPTPTPSPGLSVSAAHGAVTAIVVAALVIAALLALLGRKRK